MIDIPSVGQGLKATSFNFLRPRFWVSGTSGPGTCRLESCFVGPGPSPAKAYTTGQAGAVVERLSISAEQNCVSGEWPLESIFSGKTRAATLRRNQLEHFLHVSQAARSWVMFASFHPHDIWIHLVNKSFFTFALLRVLKFWPGGERVREETFQLLTQLLVLPVFWMDNPWKLNRFWDAQRRSKAHWQSAGAGFTMGASETWSETNPTFILKLCLDVARHVAHVPLKPADDHIGPQVKQKFQLDEKRKEVNKVQSQITEKKKASKGQDKCPALGSTQQHSARSTRYPMITDYNKWHRDCQLTLHH